MASYAVGHPILTGCHNAHRLAALREVGGLPAHDAEDLLLTLRYRAIGWRGVYVPEVLALGITPVDWAGYLKQQTRWARSILDIKLREYPALIENLQPVEKAAGLLHGVYFLRALTFPIIYALLIGLVVTGITPAFTTPGSLLRLGLAALVIALVDRFRQRFYLDPKRERGTHWRALLLQFAKWPFFMLALVRALRSRSRKYDATQKARSNPLSFGFAFVHLVIAGTIAAAWLIGRVDSNVPVTLSITCLAIVLLSVSLASTTFWRYPGPFDSDLSTRRRAELSDVFVNRSSSGAAKAEKREAAVLVDR
jgi:cellulose synthase (UDP-forming)